MSKTIGKTSKTEKKNKDNWNTTWNAFYDAEVLVGKFSADLASFEHAKKVDVCITPEMDSLSQRWDSFVVDGTVGWCNPPFSRKTEFLDKAFVESKDYGVESCIMIPLEPATKWWKKYVYGKASTVFIPDGRYNFIDDETKKVIPGVPFASCFVYFDGTGDEGVTEYEHFERDIHMRYLGDL